MDFHCAAGWCLHPAQHLVIEAMVLPVLLNTCARLCPLQQISALLMKGTASVSACRLHKSVYTQIGRTHDEQCGVTPWYGCCTSYIGRLTHRDIPERRAKPARTVAAPLLSFDCSGYNWSNMLGRGGGGAGYEVGKLAIIAAVEIQQPRHKLHLAR